MSIIDDLINLPIRLIDKIRVFIEYLANWVEMGIWRTRDPLIFTLIAIVMFPLIKMGWSELNTIKFKNMVEDSKVSKVSVVGSGMMTKPGVAKTMFKTLADNNINIQVISTSEIKITVLISSDYTELAVRTLHDAFGLGKDIRQ